ncbi:class I SAM-dependent methyltransferase [Novosphingobium album (ex Liu et al. 2023)]|uniref:Class I SAM-dependent methyltransferase n=1 Tax=Novosphingobium album (ex Liu et al. 2023) TaxID=3031130 RepID=A0ABT5WN89_9SPHN|nr:class I SAM-dependent methyltransferase [Novosphingobium album (ex Liu et al. 2023)]MDE8651511.1 class I SAM-dependent methyltransferase [Novosphingobium album (ex Liu et al. 2023)]
MTAEFDSIATSYEDQHRASIRLSGEETGFFARYKARDARRLADAHGIAPASVLDFGSGIGNAIGPLRACFPQARLTCLDVSEVSLALAHRRHGDAAAYRHYDGTALPGDLGRFDLIFTACVFHHIPPEAHVALLAQLRERLTDRGLIVLFEHNPLNPLTRHAVNTCPFDANAVLIRAGTMRARFRDAGFAAPRVEYRLFFPGFLARLRPLEPWLAAVPLGAQYLVTASRCAS